MILVEAGQIGEKYLDAKILFASLLASRGHRVVIDEDSIPENLDRSQTYEIAPFLCDLHDAKISHLLLIGAERLSDEILINLRSYNMGPDVMISAIDRFSDRQSMITTRSKLAYALGFEPHVLDMKELQSQPILVDSICPLATIDSAKKLFERHIPNILLFVPPDFLEDSLTLPILGTMSNMPSFSLHIVTSGVAKERIIKSRYLNLSVFSYSELQPNAFANLTDIAIFFGNAIPGERFAAYSLQLMRSGGLVIDCTDAASLVQAGAPAICGPTNIGALSSFLDCNVLRNRLDISARMVNNQWLEDNSIERLESALSLKMQAIEPNTDDHIKPRAVFIPTNGVGLGHAQRCSVIASSMSNSVCRSFAAFPSCVPMLQYKGFPCISLVQKSESHADIYANDIVNYLRFRNCIRTGDHLIFDGVYIFDSIYRTILEKRLRSTWIRRGLWQAGQVTETSLEREKAFYQVIVPTEAFKELNSNYSFGDQVHQVGPIVQKSILGPSDHDLFRNRLKTLLNRDFKHLVVTMLGGGVAADRSAQMQMLCALFEHRTDCLNLIVVWPNAKVSSGIYGWNNTHVVATKNALSVCMASDLVISAVGYNSFHELLYHGVPTIFVPQMAAYMDDQERRARAASERGFSATILATELLMLEREVRSFLDDGKNEKIRNCLVSAAFPEPGNNLAASLIERSFDI
ncbi:MAG: glycosyltransferase [Pseudorhodobacter sp.]|nr:glycosyltransferase [Pseudorhodobacter sp.]